MATTPEIVGAPSTVVWGTNSLVTGYGIQLNVSRTESGDKEEIPDGNGGVVLVVYFNRKGELEFNAVKQSDITNPAHADQVTINAVVTLVDSVADRWERGKAASIAVKSTRYPDVTLV